MQWLGTCSMKAQFDLAGMEELGREDIVEEELEGVLTRRGHRFRSQRCFTVEHPKDLNVWRVMEKRLSSPHADDTHPDMARLGGTGDLVVFFAFPRNSYYTTAANVMPFIYANTMLVVFNTWFQIVSRRSTYTSFIVTSGSRRTAAMPANTTKTGDDQIISIAR
ncbi:hypothetical protein DFH08DRAFT_798967 [Mycena albidolilacea]|uniref:Uncharacterized protein n=1 Tax=Mycena albidolilacea TaxID=1033008 RepID=A0AAD7F493_9AGAR|nr:hypothetical protein DFH08DRAFT_798967 [Mycena albidolilacea]